MRRMHRANGFSEWPAACVFVELELAPWVWRLNPDAVDVVTSHTGQLATVHAAITDERGIFTCTPMWVWAWYTRWTWTSYCRPPEAGHWQLTSVPSHSLPRTFGYVLSPAAMTGKQS